MEGTSSQNRIKIEANEMATIPMDTLTKVLTKGCLPLHFQICSSFCKYHSEQDEGCADVLFGGQEFSSDPVAEKGRRYRFHNENDCSFGGCGVFLHARLDNKCYKSCKNAVDD